MKNNYAYSLITVLIWSTMAAVAKSLLNNIPNLEVLSISSIIAFVFLFIVNICGGSIRKIRNYRIKDLSVMAGLGFIGLFMYSDLYYYGLSVLSSQEACILNYLWPILLVLFSAPILKEKLTGIKITAILCSFIGIIILSYDNIETDSRNRMLGIVSCIAAAICYSLFSVLNRKVDYDQNITMMIIWLTVAVCAAAAGSVSESWILPEGVQWAGIIWLGAVIDAAAYLSWAIALKGTENTASIANMAYLTPFLSLVISAVFLHENITVKEIISLIFIIGGIALQNIFPHMNKR